MVWQTHGKCHYLHLHLDFPAAEQELAIVRLKVPEVADRLAQEVGSLARNEEDVLSYALFPREAIEYFKDREMNEKGVNLKEIAAVAVLYMRSTERKPTADVCAGKEDQWKNMARREQMRQGGWLI